MKTIKNLSFLFIIIKNDDTKTTLVWNDMRMNKCIFWVNYHFKKKNIH